MAKNKNNKDSRLSAGDLLGKLGKKDTRNADNAEVDEVLEFNDEINVSSDSSYEDDSELDINALLRKYMPDFSDDDKSTDDAAPELLDDEILLDEESEKSGGVISKLKHMDPKNDDEMLIDSLDNAFGIPEAEDEKPSKLSSLASSLKARSDDLISEYELDSDDSAVSDLSDDTPDDTSLDISEDADLDIVDDEEYEDDEIIEEPVKKSIFSRLFGSSDDEDYDDDEDDDDDDEDDDEDFEPETEKKSFLALLFKRGRIDDAEDDIFSENVDVSEIEDEDTESEEEQDEILDEDYTEDFEETLSDEQEASDDASLSDFEEPDDEIDPTDINLMVAFGLDADENQKAKEFGDRLEAKQHERIARKVKLDRPEFVDKTQIPELKKEFHDKKIMLWVKLSACAIFTILLMIFENMPTFTKLMTGTGKQFAGAFDPAVYPTVYIMVSLQLMLLACFCAAEEIINGFKSLFRGIPKPESMTALLMVSGIIYSAVLANVIISPNEPVMFNFVTALSALLTLIYAIFNHKREAMNFAVVASRKPKHIVRRLEEEESEGESRAFAENDDVCDVMKIEKTDFIEGFFGRLYKPDATTGVFMTFAMSVSAAIAVIFGIFANLKGGNGADITRTIYSALLVLVPMSVYVTFSYPFYRANVAAKEYDSAIIGDTSLEEYSNASIISFDDKNVFPSYSVKVQNIKIHNNARIDRVFYYAASVFAYAGGPLQDVFEVTTKDIGISDSVKIFDTEAGFLATQVDGVNIIFGSPEALKKRGLNIPADALRDDIDISDELSIMYMFREDKLVAKMWIKYVMDADIDLILKQFSGSGLYVCVRTFDPNITERMIAKKAGMKKMPLKIVRYSNAEEVTTYEEKVNSGLVTCGSPKSLLQIISYCAKVLHTKKTNLALGVLSVMIGVAILTLLLLADSLTILTSLLIVIYQLVWLIPITISSKIFIR